MVKRKETLQEFVDRININAPSYCAKSLTVRETPDGETSDITDDD